LNGNELKFESTKIVTGERVLRLHSQAGYVLEKKLDGRVSVVRQKQQLVRMLEAALASVQKSSA
jgi:hypothetical protein